MQLNSNTGLITRIRSALFVDFDNIYLGLRNTAPDAAEAFASNPNRWIRWIERNMKLPFPYGDPLLKVSRTVLLRQCYLNPKTFYNQRAFFTRSAFKVIDCPPLTGSGKNSADIQMVMDILDALEHPTHYDEFIILSGDADFTPVLLRLRAYDRRTAVLTIGQAAEAFKAACDLMISETQFIEDALGLRAEDYAPQPKRQIETRVNPALIEKLALRVYSQASSDGEIEAQNLPRILKEFSEFRDSTDWLGFGSLRNLAEDLVQRNPQLQLIETDPWKLAIVQSTTTKNGKSAPEGSGTTKKPNNDALKEKIVQKVRVLVQNSNEPVLMAKAAEAVIDEFGQQVLESNWAGAGTFKALLQTVTDLGLEIYTAPGNPGMLLDPRRHQQPGNQPTAAGPDAIPEELENFIRKINQLVGVPALSPSQYQALFSALEKVLQTSPYHFTATSKAVRDMILEKGVSAARYSVSYVLRGISYAGHRFGEDPSSDTAVNFSRLFYENVVNLCSGGDVDLTGEEDLLKLWLLGERSTTH
ncbi:MAG TPA: NYN domain-containing protein [Anaerolineales bacterium]|nr:NYN domain-containing protein [Anaerolineales bacterium]